MIESLLCLDDSNSWMELTFGGGPRGRPIPECAALASKPVWTQPTHQNLVPVEVEQMVARTVPSFATIATVPVDVKASLEPSSSTS